MKSHVPSFLKIVFVLVVSYAVTIISSQIFFYPSSPRINPQFIATISNFFQKKNPIDDLKNLPLTAMKKISQGVYAKEEPTFNTTFVRITDDARIEIKNQVVLLKQ